MVSSQLRWRSGSCFTLSTKDKVSPTGALWGRSPNIIHFDQFLLFPIGHCASRLYAFGVQISVSSFLVFVFVVFPDVEDGARSDTARCILYRSVKPAPLLGFRDFWETLGKRRFPTVSISETVRETLDPSFGNAINALGNALHSISNTVSQSGDRSPR